MGYRNDILDAVSKQCQFLNPATEEEPGNQTSCDIGRKITIDNFHYRQNVHHMTEHHQNIDVHHVSVMSTENRVSGVELSNEKKPHGIMDLENGKCIPSPGDHILQRRNFITLVERVIVANIRSLEFLADVVTPHTQHKYSSEMRKKTNTVSKFTCSYFQYMYLYHTSLICLLVFTGI